MTETARLRGFPEVFVVSLRRLCLILASLAIALVGTPLPTGATSAGSLPTVTSGARPGPDVLYAPAPEAPQLENRHPRFRAQTLRVAATEAYIDGEFLHTDYLYDDYGADTNGQRGGSSSPRAGDMQYPDRKDYAGNAADIVEVRIAPGTSDVMYRITLNSLLRKDTTIVALAFDTDRDAATGADTLPRDPRAPFPGTDEVITVWGTGAEHSTLSGDGEPVTTPVDVRTDLEANQMTVTVPRSVSDPRGVWRTTLAAGLYDAATGGWRETEDANGNEGPNDIFNLAFRYDEAIQTTNNPPDVNQSDALRNDNPTRYAHDIDFGALDAGDNRTTVPKTGRQIRMFPSRLRLGEGRTLANRPKGVLVFPQYRGQLQQYLVYIPTKYRPARPVGLTLSLHSLDAHYWQYQYGRVFDQLGEQRDNIVVSPMARGSNGWYQREAEYDVFEVWNDVARHFDLDARRAYIWGYSMGGYGTYRLGSLYPDLFARAFTVVATPGEGIWAPPLEPTGYYPEDESPAPETLTTRWLENVRNLPYMNLAAKEDEFVPFTGPRAQNLGAPELGIEGFEQLGYRYRFLMFSPAEHMTLAYLGYDFPEARDHLGNARVDRNPPHVTFAYLPATDAPKFGLIHDHAYWVSDVRLTDAKAETSKGVVDARSRAFGIGDPKTESTQGAGVMGVPYVEKGQRWLPPKKTPAENTLELSLTNVRSVTVDTARARLDPEKRLTIESDADGATAVSLAGDFPSGTVVTQDGERIAAARTASGLTFSVAEGRRTYVIAQRNAAGPPEPDDDGQGNVPPASGDDGEGAVGSAGAGAPALRSAGAANRGSALALTGADIVALAVLGLVLALTGMAMAAVEKR